MQRGRDMGAILFFLTGVEYAEKTLHGGGAKVWKVDGEGFTLAGLGAGLQQTSQEGAAAGQYDLRWEERGEGVIVILFMRMHVEKIYYNPDTPALSSADFSTSADWFEPIAHWF